MALTSPQLRTARGSALVAAIDAGVTIIPAAPARIITVVDVWMRSTGSTDTCDSVDVTDGHTVFASFEDAALTNGALKRIGAANTAFTNLGTAAASGHGIQVKTAGAGIGTATAIEYCVHYKVSSKAAA